MSSYVDEDTARAVESGRESAAAFLQSFQRELKKVFLVFVLFFLGTVLALRLWIWDWLEGNVTSQMSDEVAEQLRIVAITPFDVILMQIKVGLIVGAVAGLVVGLYLARKNILSRVEETVEITAPRVYGFVVLSAVLAVFGMAYAYGVFFPLMFMVLAEQAFGAGVTPNYGIVHFTQFLLLLTLSFGLAAQLPLLMGALAYTEVVPYETFRDKWRYAVLGIFVFGAVFSPPDPFTQILWAIPLITLYAFSLGLAKVVANVHRAGQRASPVEAGTFRWKGYQVLGITGGAFLLTAVGLATGVAVDVAETVLASVPAAVELPGLGTVGLPSTIRRGGPLNWLVRGLQAALLLGGVSLLYHLIDVLKMPVVPRHFAPGAGDPEELDLRDLDAAGVEAAPPQAFAALSEEEAVEIAGEAMEAGHEEKGKLVLQRWEAIDEEEVAGGQEEQATSPEEFDFEAADASAIHDAHPGVFVELTEEEAIDLAGEAMEAGDDAKGTAILQRWEELEDVEEVEALAEDEDDGEGDVFDEGLLAGTTAGVLDAITAEERDEDDIGGYLYDIGFVLDSLRSSMFVVFGLFMAVFVGTFAYLYTVGIEHVVYVFVRRVDHPQFQPDLQENAVHWVPWTVRRAAGGPGGPGVPSPADVLVALHPVEVLIFIVKFSGVLAFIVTLPVLMYYAWPALQARTLVPSRGDRRGFLLWGGVVIVTTLAGSLIGFFGFAPAVISYLLSDALDAGMVISYRIKNLLWIVFFMTLGIGLLANVPVGMLLLHYMGLVRFRTFHRWWRQIVLGIFVAAMFITPSGVLTMVIFAIPIALAYLFGLGVLWVLTAPVTFARAVKERLPAVRR